MYYKMKMYFDKDFLEQNLFLRFMVTEPDLTFVRVFSHLFTSEEAEQASGFTKEMLVSYLNEVHNLNVEYKWMQGPINNMKQIRPSKIGTRTGIENPYNVIRFNTSPKEYKEY